MASFLLRRSGIAVGLVADCIGWRADQVYQVGIGWHHQEIDVLREEWPEVEVWGVEPHPEVFKSLSKSYPGMCLNLALGEKKGEAILNIKRRHADGSSLKQVPGDSVRQQAVKVETLDGLWASRLACSSARVLLWLDCEGSELDVLRGGEEFLRKVDVVNVEMAARPHGPDWAKPEEIHRHLIERDFWLQWIHTQRISAGQCDYIYVRPRLFHPEYCCVPQEMQRWRKSQQ